MNFGLTCIMAVLCLVSMCLAQFSPYGLPPPHKYKKFYRRLNKGIYPVAFPVPVPVQAVPVPVPVPVHHGPAYPLGGGYGGGYGGGLGGGSQSSAHAYSKTVSINTPGGLSINVAKAESNANAGSSNNGGGNAFGNGFGGYGPPLGGFGGFNTASANANANAESFNG